MKLNFLLKLMQFYSILCIFIQLMHFKLIHCILSTTDIGTYSKIIYAHWNQYSLNTGCFPFNCRISRVHRQECGASECEISPLLFLFSKIATTWSGTAPPGLARGPKEHLLCDDPSQLCAQEEEGVGRGFEQVGRKFFLTRCDTSHWSLEMKYIVVSAFQINNEIFKRIIKNC